MGNAWSETLDGRRAATGPLLQVSLFVELLRSRPALVFWTAALAQAGLWALVPAFLYGAPPGDIALLLAVGHQWPLGSPLGPPLADWLAELAFDLTGHRVGGIYLLAQACVVVTFWAVFQLGRATVGPQHAVLAVLLMTGIAAFSVPSATFGPRVLATPLIALALLHYWRAVGQNRPRYWFALALDLGLLLLTTYTGLILIMLLGLFTASTRPGRAALSLPEPWLAGLVATSIIFPHLIWIDRSSGASPPVPTVVWARLTEQIGVFAWLRVVGFVVALHIGLILLLLIAGRPRRDRRSAAPAFARAPMAAFAKSFLYVFSVAPAFVATVLAVLLGRSTPVGGSAPLVILSGLAVIAAAGDVIRLDRQHLLGFAWAALLLLPPAMMVCAVVLPPWTVGVALAVDRPATAMGQFFTDTFRRRTGQPLAIVAGESAVAGLVAMASPDRPSLLLTDAREPINGINPAELAPKGAVIVWALTDASGGPPPAITARFPDLVLEVPRSFERPVQGRLPLYRVGWAIVRPRPQAALSRWPD